jgi:alanyl-tRNA synthetase
VSRTGAIGPILLRRTERTRGTMRLEFRCGHRAIARARHDMELLLQVAGTLSAGVEDVPELVRAMGEDRRALDKELTRATELLLAHEAKALHASVLPDANGRRLIVTTRDDVPVKALQSMAQQVVACGNAIYLAVSTSPPAVLLAVSADLLRLLEGAAEVAEVRGSIVTRWQGALARPVIGRASRLAEIDVEVAALPRIALVGSGVAGNGLAGVVGRSRLEAVRTL